MPRGINDYPPSIYGCGPLVSSDHPILRAMRREKPEFNSLRLQARCVVRHFNKTLKQLEREADAAIYEINQRARALFGETDYFYQPQFYIRVEATALRQCIKQTAFGTIVAKKRLADKVNATRKRNAARNLRAHQQRRKNKLELNLYALKSKLS